MQEHPRRYLLGGLENPQAVACEDVAAVLQVYLLLPDTTSVQAGLIAKIAGPTVGKNDVIKFCDGSVARLQLCFEALPSHRIFGVVQDFNLVEKIIRIPEEATDVPLELGSTTADAYSDFVELGSGTVAEDESSVEVGIVEFMENFQIHV